MIIHLHTTIEIHDTNSEEFRKILELLGMGNTIQIEEEDPLFPDKGVTPGWYVANWGFPSLSSFGHPARYASYRTPYKLREMVQNGEFPRGLGSGRSREILLEAIQRIEAQRQQTAS